MKMREDFHLQMQQLNRRGTASPVSTAADGERKVSISGIARMTLEYLAGLIGGEGSLMISKAFDAVDHRPRYGSRIALSGTDRSVLEDVQKAFGGILVAQPSGREGWRDAYQVVWSSGMAGVCFQSSRLISV